MKIQLIRNATLRVDYAGTRFLIDPFLADKEAYPPFEGTANDHLRNPRVPLPVSVAEVVDVDAVIVTHTHPDHWDEAAVHAVPKHLPVFTQHEQDQELIRSQGFTDVRLLREGKFNDIALFQTKGQHGSDAALEAIGEILGKVCGVVFQHASEKTLYLAGDTLWNEHVIDALSRYQPEVIVLNAGDAQVPGLGSIIMGTEDVYRVHRAAPNATLIADHMEAVNHSVLSRKELRAFAKEKGFADHLLVPEDGEAYDL